MVEVWKTPIFLTLWDISRIRVLFAPNIEAFIHRELLDLASLLKCPSPDLLIQVQELLSFFKGHSRKERRFPLVVAEEVEQISQITLDPIHLLLCEPVEIFIARGAISRLVQMCHCLILSFLAHDAVNSAFNKCALDTLFIEGESKDVHKHLLWFPNDILIPEEQHRETFFACLPEPVVVEIPPAGELLLDEGLPHSWHRRVEILINSGQAVRLRRPEVEHRCHHIKWVSHTEDGLVDFKDGLFAEGEVCLFEPAFGTDVRFSAEAAILERRVQNVV